jgi:hypothetical protein
VINSIHLRRWDAIIFRVLALCFGLTGILWGAFFLPIFWTQATIAPAAARILAGDSFKTDALDALDAAAKPLDASAFCVPAGLRESAVIKIRQAELAITNGQRDFIEQRLEAARAGVQRSLTCAPADSFLWLARFWLENNVSGLRSENFSFLRMAYRLGPNEGWIMLKRNRYTVVLYPQLPPDLRESAAHEFVRLLDSDLITDAAQIFLGPGAAIQDVLLSRINGVSIARREFFTKLLRGQGYEGAIPGVEERRPR